MTIRMSATCLFAVVAALSCGGDSNGPGDSLDFPQISATLRSTYCVRANVTTGDSKPGVVNGSDCDDGSGYYETYLVRVATARTVTFSVNSSFDSYLSLVQINSFTDTDYDGTFLDFDDDSNGDLDAKLIYNLVPGVTYVVGVGGIDYSDTGSYTLVIQ